MARGTLGAWWKALETETSVVKGDEGANSAQHILEVSVVLPTMPTSHKQTPNNPYYELKSSIQITGYFVGGNSRSV
jgi:hypothetical protein